jgi:hypothetical protein
LKSTTSAIDPVTTSTTMPALGPAPEARPADAADLVRRYRDEVAARQAQVERELWLRAAGEAFPPAAEDARARLRQ